MVCCVVSFSPGRSLSSLDFMEELAGNWDRGVALGTLEGEVKEVSDGI